MPSLPRQWWPLLSLQMWLKLFLLHEAIFTCSFWSPISPYLESVQVFLMERWIDGWIDGTKGEWMYDIRVKGNRTMIWFIPLIFHIRKRFRKEKWSPSKEILISTVIFNLYLLSIWCSVLKSLCVLSFQTNFTFSVSVFH